MNEEFEKWKNENKKSLLEETDCSIFSTEKCRNECNYDPDYGNASDLSLKCKNEYFKDEWMKEEKWKRKQKIKQKRDKFIRQDRVRLPVQPRPSVI